MSVRINIIQTSFTLTYTLKHTTSQDVKNITFLKENSCLNAKQLLAVTEQTKHNLISK